MLDYVYFHSNLGIVTVFRDKEERLQCPMHLVGRRKHTTCTAQDRGRPGSMEVQLETEWFSRREGKHPDEMHQFFHFLKKIKF